MAIRRFEFQDSDSNKYWEVDVTATPIGAKLWRRWGKMGTQGQTVVQEMSASKARDEMFKLIEQKLAKGYREVKAFALNDPRMVTTPQQHIEDSKPRIPPKPVIPPVHVAPPPPVKEEQHRPSTLEEIRQRFKA
jgi:predicted DNA-binding WGR domain protein